MMGEVHFAELKAISCGVTAKKTEIRVSMPQAWPKTPPEISGLGARCFAAGRQTLSASISKINLKIQRATEYWTLPPGRRGRSGPVWAEPGASWEYSTIPKENGLALWVGTESHGLYRIHDGVADHYGKADGLSGDSVGAIFEDKEGDLWVTTDRGVDMFRDLPVLTFSTSEGFIGSFVHSVLALSDGSVWVGNIGAVDIVRAGRVSAIAGNHGLPG